MAKLSNLLVMINLLKTGRKYSIKELSTYLEVSERTICEYKLFLEEAGIYVDTIRGVYGGYVLKQEMNLPKIRNNENDIEIIKDASKYVDYNLSERLNNLANKINNNMLADNNDDKKLIINDNELKIYNTLSKALKYNYKVKIHYYNLQHGKSTRTIYPL